MPAMNWKSFFSALALAFTAATVWYAVTAAPAGAGLMAKQLCLLEHVSGLAPDYAMNTWIMPLLGPATRVMSLERDPVRRQIHVNALGFHTSTAVYQPGHGCIQLHERTVADIDELLPPRRTQEPEVWSLDKAHRNMHFDTTALRTTLVETLKIKGTQAVLVVHHGHIVAESYAEGITGDTPLPGWSMAKTITAVVAGMLAKRSFLSPDEVALFKPWEEDDRIHITLDQLLRMTSGINIIENKTGADANSHMLFKTGDSTAYAIGRRLRDTPGETFAYTSGSTMLAARLLSDRLGGKTEALEFIRNELFEPLGMRRTWLEPDETGQFIGSSFVMASAHDWARLGQMLLAKGSWQDTQYFDKSWLDYMTEPTPQATDRPYGAGVWLIDPAHPRQTWMHKLPADTFYASGLQTNQLWVIPSRDLIVVRLGATNDFFKSGVPELLAAILAAQVDPETQSAT